MVINPISLMAKRVPPKVPSHFSAQYMRPENPSTGSVFMTRPTPMSIVISPIKKVWSDMWITFRVGIYFWVLCDGRDTNFIKISELSLGADLLVDFWAQR